MGNHYEVIVVGAGSMGMAAGYFLAKNGTRTLLIDANDPPHTQGSHHGDTRIIRHAYGEGREYVPLALRAQELWNELEKKSHLKIFTQVGAIGFGPEGESAFIDEAIASGKSYNLEIDLLTGKEMNERWPGLTVPDDYIAFYEPNSGFLYSENCIRAYRELAAHHGAEFSMNNPVVDIEAYEDGVKVITKNGVFTADKLILSGGAWSGKIAESLDLHLPITPTRQPVAWFEAEESLYNTNTFPTFMVEVPNGDSKAIYYGFPTFGGCGVKVGRHEYVDEIDPDTMNRDFGSDDNDEAHIREYLERFMPQANGALKKGAICIYSRTPDGHFIIDKHPAYPHISFAAGFAGHGFKFASVVGEILTQLALRVKLSMTSLIFSVDRPALKTPVENVLS